MADIIGTANGETLIGTDQDDLISGLAGNDVLFGLVGSDVLDGGEDIDTAAYSAESAAVAVTLNGASDTTVILDGVNADIVRNIENVIGGSGIDLLTGDALANTFHGGGGADVLDGSDGSDTADYSDKTGFVVVP